MGLGVCYVVDTDNKRIGAYLINNGNKILVGPCVPPANFEWPATDDKGPFLIPFLVPVINETKG